MNKDQFMEKLENLKGKLKERVASISANKHKEGEGLAQQTKGTAQEKAGEFREEIESEAKDSGRKANEGFSYMKRDPDED